MANPIIKPADRGDAVCWERMRQKLWPSQPGDHAADIARYFGGDRWNPSLVLIARDDTGEPVGFAELSIRGFTPGCHSRRVGFLEGWFVEPAFRRKGIGAALVRAGEEWARAEG